MQRLQRQAKPVLVPGDQAALLRDCRQAQPRLARVRHSAAQAPLSAGLHINNLSNSAMCPQPLYILDAHNGPVAATQAVSPQIHRGSLCPDAIKEAAAHVPS